MTNRSDIPTQISRRGGGTSHYKPAKLKRKTNIVSDSNRFKRISSPYEAVHRKSQKERQRDLLRKYGSDMTDKEFENAKRELLALKSKISTKSSGGLIENGNKLVADIYK